MGLFYTSCAAGVALLRCSRLSGCVICVFGPIEILVPLIEVKGAEWPGAPR